MIFLCRWKLHEGAMLALGSIRNLIIESVKKEKIQFDLQGILQTVVLADLNQNGMFDGFSLGVPHYIFLFHSKLIFLTQFAVL